MKSIVVAVVASLVAASCGQAPPAAEPAAATAPAKAPVASTAKYAAKVPSSILTPDSVETRIGPLKFFDGLPDADTVKKVYDNLDFARGVEAFMAGIPATSVQALKNGFIEAGFPPNGSIGITESLADARSVFLTPNATVVYEWFCADVGREPMVIEVPPGVLGLIDDAYFRFLADMGQFGPDQGKGGKFLLVRSDYTGALPKQGYYIVKTPSNNNLIVIRAFVQGGDLAGTVKFELRAGKPVLLRLPALNYFDDREGKPIAIYRQIGRRPIAAFGNSDGDLQMLQWTCAGPGARYCLFVRHTDAEREFAYDKSPMGALDAGLKDAAAKGWTVVDMKTDWNIVYVFQKK